ncbi:AAA family ATPase [Polaromonas aquatica]|uniref:AAA family ATPase n=1 Tax=Polaromonas aquatica TaxID=332657 RepID=UPI003D660288
MTDPTKSPADIPPGDDAPAASLLAWFKASIARVRDWLSVQSLGMRLTVLAVVLMIPASALYAWSTLQRQEKLSLEVKAMAAGQGSEAAWAYNTTLPVVFGSGSVLSFLEAHPVARITIIYRPILWTVSERFVLVESEGRQYAYYPSDMETKILADKAVTAPWGGKLTFVPQAALDDASKDMLERLEQRFGDARPQAEQGAWKGGASALVSATLTLGLIAFLWYQTGGQRKALKFISPAQISGDLSDLVGMDDIKAEVAQIRDQYERRLEYAAYGVNKPFNVMFSGPAGTGKTKLASYLAKELNLPILFHSAANLETGYVAGGSNTLSRILALAKRRKRCIVFLDEAQDLFMKRGGNRKYDDDTQNMLLAILDGVRTKTDAEIIWIVASNFNSANLQMDEAMLRRFQMKVDFRMPNQQERLAITGHYLRQRANKVLPDMDLRHFVELTEGCSPADLETMVNQAGIIAVQAGQMIGAHTLMQAAERVLVGNVNDNTTKERERDRRIIAVHEWGHFLMDFQHQHKLAGGNWDTLLANMTTIKISLKANPRNNALGFVLHKQDNNLLQTKGDMEHEVRVLLGGMANEELFFGEDGTTGGAHNDITRVTRLLHHAVAEMGMYRKTRLNYAALVKDGGSAPPDEETRSIMEAQSERLYSETKATLAQYTALTEHLTVCLMRAGEMTLSEALGEIRRFESLPAAPALTLPGMSPSRLMPA